MVVASDVVGGAGVADVAGAVAAVVAAVVVVAVVDVVIVVGLHAATASTSGRNLLTLGFYERRCLNPEAAASSTRNVISPSTSASILAGYSASGSSTTAASTSAFP